MQRKIREYFLQDLGPEAIHAKISEDLKGSTVYKVPSVRTIQNVVLDLRLERDAREKLDRPLDLTQVEEAGLPAESVPVLLKVLADRIKFKAAGMKVAENYQEHLDPMQQIKAHGANFYQRAFWPWTLTVRRARWLWWTHCAAPDLSVQMLWSYARLLAIGEQLKEAKKGTGLLDSAIATLALKPWEGEKAQADWRDAHYKGLFPAFSGTDEQLAAYLLQQELAFAADTGEAQRLAALISAVEPEKRPKTRRIPARRESPRGRRARQS